MPKSQNKPQNKFYIVVGEGHDYRKDYIDEFFFDSLESVTEYIKEMEEVYDKKYVAKAIEFYSSDINDLLFRTIRKYKMGPEACIVELEKWEKSHGLDKPNTKKSKNNYYYD